MNAYLLTNLHMCEVKVSLPLNQCLLEHLYLSTPTDYIFIALCMRLCLYIFLNDVITSDLHASLTEDKLSILILGTNIVKKSLKDSRFKYILIAFLDLEKW